MNAPIATTAPAFPPVVFSITDAGIAELEAKFKGLTVAFGDAKGYAGLVKAIAEVRTARTDVEKRRKELKQDALEYGRKVDDAAKAKAEADAKLAAEIEAAKPERERLIGYARGVLEAIPETTTTTGNRMRAYLVEALEWLLAGWEAA